MTHPSLDDQLASRLGSILDFLDQSVRAAGKFAADQAPDVVREVLIWGFWSDIIFAILAVPLTIFLVMFWKKHYQKCESEDDEDWWFGFGMCHLGYVPVFAFLVLMFVGNLLDAVKITIAPKLYLLEYASHLLTK